MRTGCPCRRAQFTGSTQSVNPFWDAKTEALLTGADLSYSPLPQLRFFQTPLIFCQWLGQYELLQARVRADVPLLTELQDIVKHGSPERRAEMLGRIATLFMEGASRFTEQHVEIFDAVLSELIIKIETKARFELATRLTGVSNAPRQLVKRLAQDDDIAVAGPLLQYSERLDEPYLLNVAKNKSQQHLLAVSSRQRIAVAITDVLVRRGDRNVVRNVAGNLGAILSRFGFATLVHKAETDGILAEKIGQRSDVPEPLLRGLFLQATRIVQKQLLATATADTKTKIQRMLAEISSEFGIESLAGSIGADRATITLDSQEANIDEAALAKYATDGLYDETVAALSSLCAIPLANMHRIMANKRAEPAIVACKALGFSWSTARAVILLQRNGLGVSAHSLENKYRQFDKLSLSGAQSVMRLWHAIDGDHASRATKQL